MLDIRKPIEYVTQLQAWLAEVEYRPGWRLEIDHGWAESLTLTIRARLEDSTSPGRMVEIGSNVPIPPYPWDRDRFIHWLADALISREVHESQEWLRWRTTGEPVFDPHADEKRARG